MPETVVQLAHQHGLNSNQAPPVFVFIRGFLGFEIFSAAARVIPYFRRIAKIMRRAGLPAAFPVLPSAASVEDRARALAIFTDKIPTRRIVLVGHSMGGLDARMLASRFDPDRRVNAIISLGTPHRGTAVAEALLTERGSLAAILRHACRPALEDLTEEACYRRNALLNDQDDVRISSWAGTRARDELPFWLRPFADRLVGQSDGLVTAESARWNESGGLIAADHFEMVGWQLSPARLLSGDVFDHVAFYRDIVVRQQSCWSNLP